MGSSKSGVWIIAIFLYFIVYFLLIYGTFTLRSQFSTSDSSVHFSDPGFYNYRQYTAYGGKCDQPGEIRRFSESGWNIGILGNCTATNNQRCAIACEDLDTTNFTCSSVYNCTWVNATSLFGFDLFPAHCTGIVNDTYYQIKEREPYCTAPGLQDRVTCETFRCSWSNTSEIYNQEITILKSQKGMNMFYQTAKFIFGFNVEFGFKQFGWLWAIFFTYIPLFILMYSIYMALPFIHGG